MKYFCTLPILCPAECDFMIPTSVSAVDGEGNELLECNSTRKNCPFIKSAKELGLK